MTIVAGTGHRPDKLGTEHYSGYIANNPLRTWVRVRARQELLRLRPFYVISGMAPGFDQDLARVAIELRIPFVAAIPFVGQEDRWPLRGRQEYRQLLQQAYEVVIVCEGGYERWKMQARNEWMVDHCTDVLAAFDGSPGGTANTVNYANRVRRPVHRIDPCEFRVGAAP